VNRFFADTFYWVALIPRKDASNRAVLEFSRTLASAVLVTTDEVLTEVLAFCSSDRLLRREAAITLRGILAARNVRVIPQSREGFLDGLTLYEDRPDKGYSLADCISMQIMHREGLTDVLSNDRQFEQEGFRTVFR
jgi:predicted nucleic acid-binding protein